MKQLGLSILLVSVFCCSHVTSVGLHGFTYQGLEEPKSTKFDPQELVIEKWITQPLDHFNHRDNRTWRMRYYENSLFHQENGPIFIMLGGEWAISTGFLESGLMYNLANQHGAMMYYTEHRYYGKSIPTKDSSTESMQFLNVDQALADVAYFIETKQKEANLKSGLVIVFGGSYAGNMAAWARLKYPHLIQGALASSAPVFAKADFFEYYETVAESLRRHSEQCAIDVKAAFDSVEDLLKTKGGPEKLKEYFNLCEVPNVNSASEIGYFMNNLAEKFAGVVQYDKFEKGRTKIGACCDNMTAVDLGSPLKRLANFVSGENCMSTSYERFVRTYRNESWDSPAAKSIMRQWFYQTCTEYGYYQTTSSRNSIFGSLVPLDYFTNLCVDLYGDYYDGEFLNGRVRRTNIMYGGVKPDLRNVIFSNGDIDPWHPLSVLKDLNEFSPAIFINGSSHCRDLYNDEANDTWDLKEARVKIRNIIGQWVS